MRLGEILHKLKIHCVCPYKESFMYTSICAGGRQMGCAGLSFAWMFLCVETQLGAIS